MLDRLRKYLSTRYDPLTSLVFTMPIFVLYHLGVLTLDVRNGADLVTGLVFRLVRASVWGYVGVTAAYVVGLAIATFALKRKQILSPKEFFPVVAESSIAALLMLLGIGYALGRIFDAQVGPPALSPLGRLVMSCGAGFHEELVFRVALFGGLRWLLARIPKVSGWVATSLAALVAGFAFASAHYFGHFGDPFSLQSFTSRFLSAIYLTTLYRWRGFAVAVYTHTLFDTIIFFTHP